MDTLLDIIREEVYKYGRSGMNIKFSHIFDEVRQVYAVTALPIPDRENGWEMVVMARVQDGYIIVEEDNTDKPLVEALIQRGIPRQQIILAYLGEALPTLA